MTVASTTNRINYTTVSDGMGGVLQTYAYPFKIFAATDLLVYLESNPVPKILNTDYTVTGVGIAGGGNVVFVVDPPLGVSLVIVRQLPLTQLTDYVEGDPFPAASHENALDRIVMIAQQFDEAVDRILTLPITSLLTNIEVPVMAGKPFRWNSGATALEAFTIGDADALNVITTQGDIIIGGVGGIADRLGAGTKGKALTTGGAGANPSWEGMTTQGDIEYHSGTTRTRLAPGTSGQLLKTKGAGANPEWTNHSKRLIFPASCFESRVAAGWANFVQVQGTNFDFGEFDFDAASDEKIISPIFRITNWDGGNITVRIGWKGNAVTGNVMWVVSFLGRDTTTPEVFDAALTDHNLSASTIPGTVEYLKETVWTGAVSELANNDAVIMKITRNADDGGDTLAVDAKLLYVEIEYNEA